MGAIIRRQLHGAGPLTTRGSYSPLSTARVTHSPCEVGRPLRLNAVRVQREAAILSMKPCTRTIASSRSAARPIDSRPSSART